MTLRKILTGLAIRIFAIAILLPAISLSQTRRYQPNILFYQLTTAQGLSDNYINNMVVDKTGNLWIAASKGLNMFNGKTVVRFFSHEYPQLKNDISVQLKCDKENRIWLLQWDGYVTLIDENRHFHRVSLYKDDKFVRTRWLLQTREHGVILFTRDGFYYLPPGKNILKEDSITLRSFSKIEISGIDTLLTKSYLQTEPYDSNSYIFNVDEGFFKVSFTEKKPGKKYSFPNFQILERWGPDDLLVISRDIPLLRSINLKTEKITDPLEGITDQYGIPLTSRVTFAKKISDDQLLLNTYQDGVYIFNINTRKLYNYRHNAADPTSITNNFPRSIAIDNTGWVFLGATPNGISYFKNNAVIGQQTIFMDKSGNSFDGYVNSISTIDNNVYFIGGPDKLLEWNRSTNTTNFLKYSIENGKPVSYNEPVNFTAFDSYNRLWVAVRNRGVFVLDKNKKLIRRLLHDPNGINKFPPDIVLDMKMQPDGHMWLAGNGGICRINIQTFAVDSLKETPLNALSNTFCYQIFFPDPDNVWVGTNKGLWHYQFSSKKMVNYTKKDGFISDFVFCINKDNYGNIYAGTQDGLYIFLQNGKSKIITDEDGLLNKRVEALILDKKNRMWMGNAIGLSCFDMKDSSLKAFDERYGLSVQGFRIGSYHHNSDDEMIWGTERGIQYFYPDDLLQQKISLRALISRVETRNVIADLTRSTTLDLSPLDNHVTFYFTSIDYNKHLRTFYEYKLDGLDKDWIKVIDQNFVRYSSLPAGKYTFRVRASNDNKLWEEASNTVSIVIAKQFWQRTWFKMVGIILGLLLIWYVLNYYRKKQIRQREELETQLVINYFASRINSYQRTEDILWDVARNCISKLKFEDCVIYLLDEDRNVLVQKAAHGPKMERDFTISQPIEIPVGRGIVGTVAKTGKPELIANTELDTRYIVDDARRYSEVAVPLITDDKVIGVIDSEHSKRNFFTQRHLTILSTIAVLCANQIQRAKAEEEKQKAKIETLENKQKVTESRLQSLRLQMNPHFLFNALNSIQQMILANEELVATRFLSRFSKLLRAILIHSDKETVTLKEELEILNLYIELEARRFKDSFHYTIECAEEIDEDEIKIPTLLIQPFVENAIWHGLMHKEGNRNLNIRFSENGDFLRCIIEDNGVGRKSSEETKKANGQDRGHISKGIKVSLERLKTIRNRDGNEGSLIMTDLYDENGQAAGTRVELNFPIQN